MLKWSKRFSIILLLLLAGQVAWGTNVTLSVDPDIPEGTAGHWFVNMSDTDNLWLTLTADDLAVGKGTFKVYDDGGKNGNHSFYCNGTLHITVPVGNHIQASGTAWTYSGLSTFLALYNAKNPDLDDFTFPNLVRSETDGEPVTFGPVLTQKDEENETDGQYMTVYFSSYSIEYTYKGFDMTVTVIDSTPHNITIADGITHGSVSASSTQAKYDEEVTLTVTPQINYHVSIVSYNDGSSDHIITPVNDTYKFRMPAHDVIVSATFVKDVEYYWGADNDGSSDKPYIISDIGGYDLLVKRSKTDSYTDKHFELAADISGVTAMIGTDSSYPFCGIIDGKGHTVTLALTQNAAASNNSNDKDSHDLGCAMILYAGKKGSGCTIRNLTVTGTITTTCQWAAGFISYAAGTIALTDCRSSVTINSSRSGSSFDAGFVSYGHDYHSTYTFTRCLFDGAFVSDVSIFFSGLLGDCYDHTNVLTLENCVVVPDGLTCLDAGGGYH